MGLNFFLAHFSHWSLFCHLSHYVMMWCYNFILHNYSKNISLNSMDYFKNVLTYSWNIQNEHGLDLCHDSCGFKMFWKWKNPIGNIVIIDAPFNFSNQSKWVTKNKFKLFKLDWVWIYCQEIWRDKFVTCPICSSATFRFPKMSLFLQQSPL